METHDAAPPPNGALRAGTARGSAVKTKPTGVWAWDVSDSSEAAVGVWCERVDWVRSSQLVWVRTRSTQLIDLNSKPSILTSDEK